jgi:HEAT repeat protein
MLWWKLQRLKSRDPKTRIAILEEMEAKGGFAVIAPMAEALRDEDPNVRGAAAKGLAKLQDERVLAPLITALSDERPDVRIAASQGLRQLGDARAIEALVHVLRDNNHLVRWHGASALDAIGWRPTTDEETILRSVAVGHYEVAGGYGKKATELLIQALGDVTCSKRHEVALALGKTGDSLAIEPLAGALTDQDSHVRVAAVEALSQIGRPECSDVLLRSLTDQDHHVRAAGVEALGRLGDVRLVEPIAQSLLRDSSWEVRKLSVEALGRVRDDRANELLCKALSDSDHDVRQTAVVALGQVPDSKSIGPLVLALKDPNSSVRQAAKASLRQIDRQWELTDGAKSVIPQLEEASHHPEYWVAQSAADTLAKINDMRQRHLDTKFLGDPGKQRTGHAINLLADMLHDSDRDFRQAAAEALGRIVDDRVVVPLVAALEDPDECVGRAAALALNHLNWAPAPDDVRRAEKLKTLMLKT